MSQPKKCVNKFATIWYHAVFFIPTITAAPAMNKCARLSKTTTTNARAKSHHEKAIRIISFFLLRWLKPYVASAQRYIYVSH